MRTFHSCRFNINKPLSKIKAEGGARQQTIIQYACGPGFKLWKQWDLKGRDRRKKRKCLGTSFYTNNDATKIKCNDKIQLLKQSQYQIGLNLSIKQSSRNDIHSAVLKLETKSCSHISLCHPLIISWKFSVKQNLMCTFIGRLYFRQAVTCAMTLACVSLLTLIPLTLIIHCPG